MGKTSLNMKPVCLEVQGEVANVMVEFSLPRDFTSRHRYDPKGCPAPLLLLLNAMRPLGSIEPGSIDKAEVHEAPQSSSFDLTSCFKALPSCKADSHLPPLLQHPSATDTDDTSSSFSDLGMELTSLILSRLEVRDLAAANLTCKFFMALGSATVPDLTLGSLYPHQRTALRWIMQKEQDSSSTPPHPFIKEWLMGSDRIPVYVNFVTGEISTDPPATLSRMKGGLFCDEPGLGKTVTALSLILKTKERLSRAPPQFDSTVEMTLDGQGRWNGFYTEGPASASIVQSSTISFPANNLAPTETPEDGSTAPTATLYNDNAEEKAPALDHPFAFVGNSTWVQCDSCNKWREMPSETLVNENTSWFCSSMGISCSEPEHQMSEKELHVTKCKGFFRSSESSGEVMVGKKRRDVFEWDDENVDHFLKTIMETLKSLDGCPWTSLSFLAEADVRKMKHPEQGLFFPSSIRMAETGYEYSTLLHALNLQTLEEFERSNELLVNMASSSSKKGQHTWLLGAGMMNSQSGLEFDQGSFRRALKLLTSFCTGLKSLNSSTTSKTLSKRIREFLLARPSHPSDPSISSPSKIQKRNYSIPSEPQSTNSSQDDNQMSNNGARVRRGSMTFSSRKAGARIYLSRATLVVLPAVLTAHWQSQVMRHVRPGALRVLVLGGEAEEQMLMPMDIAWGYDLVLTSFHRLSMEWETDLQDKFGLGKRGKNKRIPVLSQVHWKRVILDEGHQLGASLSLTNKFQQACALKADARWVMTGTPTPLTQSSDIAHLQPLLAFLHHDPYGTTKSSFDLAVRIPFEAKKQEGRERLMDLLTSCMIRAVKEDLVKLPKLHRKVTMLDFSPNHASSYNELVEVVRRNLLLADWCDENHNESILNRSSANAKWARQMMQNVRMSCCIAGAMNTVVKEEDVLDILCRVAERLGQPSPQDAWEQNQLELGSPSSLGSQGMTLEHFMRAGPPWLPDDHPLSRIEKGLREGGACDVCSAQTTQPLVTPCGHMICLDCAAPSRKRCPVPSCKAPYVMQSVSDPKRKKDNPNPQWSVPEEVIEWQPVYHQKGARGLDAGCWSDNALVTQSSKCLHLLKRLQEIGSGPSPSSDHRHHCLHQQQGLRGDPGECSSEINHEVKGILKISKARTKSLVFTQFWQHMKLIESHLISKGIGFVVLRSGGMSQVEQQASIHRFALDPDIGVLLMDSVGAVGLDLSFVSHIFLMEPLMDKSLEEQVVSRAHRMGAQRAVHVEVLVMKGTTEEHMIAMSERERVVSGDDVTREEQVAVIGVRPLDGTDGLEVEEEQGLDEDARAEAAVLGQMLSSTPSNLPSALSSFDSRSRPRGQRGSRGSQRGSGSFSSAPASAQERTRHQRNQMLLRLRKVNVSTLPDWIEEGEVQLRRLDCEWSSSFVGMEPANESNHPDPPELLPNSFPAAAFSVENNKESDEEARPERRARVRFQDE